MRRIGGAGRGRPALPPAVEDAMGRVIAANLTYLERAALSDLASAAIEVERRGLAGVIQEMGCAAGGSAIVLAKAKGRGRRLEVYDVFGMIPPPSEKDGSDVRERYRTIAEGKSEGINGSTYYGYEGDLYGKVRARFAEYGVPAEENEVHLVRGLYEETLRADGGPVALAHVDCDWYESVMVCLERTWPRLVPGGRLVIDDYHHWSGCRSAVDDYFGARPRGEFRMDPRSRLHVVRVAGSR